MKADRGQGQLLRGRCPGHGSGTEAKASHEVKTICNKAQTHATGEDEAIAETEAIARAPRLMPRPTLRL